MFVWGGFTALPYNLEAILDAFESPPITNVHIFLFVKNASSVKFAMIPFHLKCLVQRFLAILNVEPRLTRMWQRSANPHQMANAYGL